MVLQLRYGNGVFGNVYLSAGQQYGVNITVKGVVDTFGHVLILLSCSQRIDILEASFVPQGGSGLVKPSSPAL